MIKQAYMQSGQALGTEVELRLVVTDFQTAEDNFKILWKEIYDFEKRYSRFNIDSDVTKLNMNAGKPMLISPELVDILEQAKKFAAITGGLFNIFVLPEVERGGYIESMTPKPGQQIIDYTDRKVVDMSSLNIGNGSVSIPQNTAIDLGGIGKGYLLDKLASILEGRIENYCLSLGGDMILKGQEISKNWEVDVQSGVDRTRNVALFVGSGRTEAVATSGMIREKGGKRQIHIVDPREEKNSGSTFALCSVAAVGATAADVIASALIIGEEELAEELIRQGHISAVLLQKRTGGEPIIFGAGFKMNS
ncbi:MAG: FAD:protein FMN transferase [Candidatus Paceibacterota bacterium]|jgi:thiamine biosynthesis lipoprotein